MQVSLVFPHQLFRQHPALDKKYHVILLEEWLFFNQYHFHKQKLVLHRSSMRFYAQWLQQKGYNVEYINAADQRSHIQKFITSLSKKGVTVIHIAEVCDDWLHSRLHKQCKKLGITVHVYQTPGFLNGMNELNDYFDNRKSYFQTDFYTWQRKQKNLLLSAGKQPEGGKWTYDSENRSRFPKHEVLPTYYKPMENEFVTEARDYVNANFSKNYGNAGPPFARGNGGYPCTFEQAEKWLDDFLENRLAKFGKYQDAIVGGQHLLYHSLLSPLLNTGLLVPQQVLEKTLQAAHLHKVPLNSLEGFIRQLVGWREFVRAVYEREGRKQRTKNYWHFNRAIPHSLWTGQTGIAPVDHVIAKALETGYSHHIERLMIMGNFMLLCEFNPDEVYRWFMEMYIDSYDWVMVPNVYGMALFADGGLMVTKPYISGSNYILKMSDFKKGPWCQVWDALFWRFMMVHRSFFETNPRLAVLLKTLDRMTAAKRETYMEIAENFLETLNHH
ncbi:cryptochrome/photolyase family protein [Foetidibacter luteolus]|uniref:cryptochrome/photolyase family protein n=1 Tax=Foetidibacter luteolus TaxID=2608880 RepID=UPI00129AE99D|nr:cryptochrome/photolyase family protein [Foetidibacter luteolus]